MFEHPLYKPIFEFKQTKRLPANLSNAKKGWLLWSEGAETAQCWQFLDSHALLVAPNAAPQYEKWVFLPNIGMLELFPKKANAEPEVWEIWTNEEPMFMQLRNPLTDKILYFLHTSAVEANILNELRIKPIGKIPNIFMQLAHLQAQQEANIWSKHQKAGCLVSGGLLILLFLVSVFFKIEDIIYVLILAYLSVPTYSAHLEISKNRILRGFLPRQPATIFLSDKMGFFKNFVLLFFLGILGFFVLLLILAMSGYLL
jgi:hypothetical protein